MSAQLNDKELMTLKVINRYLLGHGVMPSIRKIMDGLGYEYPRSVVLIIDKLITKGFLKKNPDGSLKLIRSEEVPHMEAETREIPLVGTVACGTPILAEQNIEALYPVSTKLAPPTNKYFLLRASGDSMELKGINDGDLVLVKQQATAIDGQTIVALIDDSATVKEYRHKGETVVLLPHSNNSKHQPIIMTSDFLIQGIVVATIPMT